MAVTVLLPRYNSPTDSGEVKVERHASSETRPNQATHCFLTQFPLNLEASHTNVSEETLHLATGSACIVPSPPQESLVCDGTRTSLPAKPSPNPDNAGPIAHRPVGLPVEPGLEPGSLVSPRYSALDHCATQEARQRYSNY